jgi:hypothetical protein
MTGRHTFAALGAGLRVEVSPSTPARTRRFAHGRNEASPHYFGFFSALRRVIVAFGVLPGA